MEYLVAANAGAEYWTEERCYITEMCNTSRLPMSSLAIARVEPGVRTQLHSLTGTTETYIVIEGTGTLEVDGIEFAIQPGDQVIIPPGISQRVTTTGANDLRFYCLCTPRFEPGCYVNLEG